MKKLLFSISILFLLSSSLIAQNNNNYWFFGNNAGIYFDSVGVYPVVSNLHASEGTASISDGCGLLFYTDGDTVWNKNKNMMMNGFDIGGRCTNFGRSSSTQAALIVRQPANDSLFYIFTTDCIEDLLVDGLRYSIVNINKNGGLGEVIVKNQILFPLAEEKITASRHANGCDVWIISHEFGSNNFYSYLLTQNGLNIAPVISSVGQIHNCTNPQYPDGRGYLKASPSGNKLINVNPDGVYSFCDTTLAELFNFNQANGTVTSEFIFPRDTSEWWSSYDSWSIPFYGASFSPDNSKLYLSSGFYGPNLYQYDLNAGSFANIIASKTLLAYPYPFPSNPYNIPTALAIAPDGKIYISQRDRNYLGVINNPNSLGINCNYVDSTLALMSGTNNDWGGLPNFFEDYNNFKSIKAEFNYIFSTNGDTVFFNNTSLNAIQYNWNFGDGTTSNVQHPIHVYQDTGIYTVSLTIQDSLCNIDKYCETIYVPTVTSVLNIFNTKLTIKPNPFFNHLYINSNSLEELEIIIYDALSRFIFSKKFFNSVKIETEKFKSGIYIYEIKNKHGSLSKGKIVKHRE